MKLNTHLKVLLIGANIWYFSEGMFGPLYVIFAQKIGGDILDISWAYASYLITAGILYIVIGEITDRQNNKEIVLVLGYLLNTIFTFSYLFVSNTYQLFFVQAGLGVAVALATPTWYAIYSKHASRKYAGFQWGVSEGSERIISGIGIIVGGLIVNFLSFEILFIFMGFLQLIATIYQAKILFLKH